MFHFQLSTCSPNASFHCAPLSMVVSCWLIFLSALQHHCEPSWMTVVNTSYHGQKKFNAFGCLCPEVQALLSLLFWLGDLLDLLAQKWEAEAWMYMSWSTLMWIWNTTLLWYSKPLLKSRYSPCRSQESVGESRFGKDQSYMDEADVFASLGWLH